MRFEYGDYKTLSPQPTAVIIPSSVAELKDFLSNAAYTIAGSAGKTTATNRSIQQTSSVSTSKIAIPAVMVISPMPTVASRCTFRKCEPAQSLAASWKLGYSDDEGEDDIKGINELVMADTVHDALSKRCGNLSPQKAYRFSLLNCIMIFWLDHYTALVVS